MHPLHKRSDPTGTHTHTHAHSRTLTEQSLNNPNCMQFHTTFHQWTNHIAHLISPTGIHKGFLIL